MRNDNLRDKNNRKVLHNSLIIENNFGDYDASSVVPKIMPVLYLKSDITLSGEGTQSNPYIIK